MKTDILQSTNEAYITGSVPIGAERSLHTPVHLIMLQNHPPYPTYYVY